ncbi:amino acid ABC transporter permease [Verminephrobacter eiseniae]|uniref:amino acid ABC transporter permease n=1 Tax=Verminephrobacter eiseniae TaxID=364317 RepID=UPI002238D8C7|nr:amino acid ABC transporter permease [Verminephrobacter eiseniae]
MTWNATVVLWAQYGASLLAGLATTLELAAIAIAGSLLLGTLVSLASLSRWRPIRAIAAAYVDFVRCVPLLVHAMFWYFGATELLPPAVKEWIYEQDLSMIAGATALIVYSASFVAEDIRSGIRSISSGQIEAARALGFGFLRSFRWVIFPQAIEAVIPPLIGQAMVITKNTSVTLMIGVVELINATRRVQDATFRIVEPYAFATLSYLIVCSLLTLLAMRYERWAKGGAVA